MLRLELSTLSNDLCNILYFLWFKVLPFSRYFGSSRMLEANSFVLRSERK